MIAQPLWALVPLRGGAGKKRLAALMDADQRRELVAAMADDVLTALCATPAIHGVAVTTSDAALAGLARAHGALVISDAGTDGLNAAVDQAARRLMAQGAASLLVVHGDLPQATPQAVETLLAAHEGGVTVARAAQDGGSNALLISPPDVIGFHFGPDSCTLHLETARKAGISAKALVIPGLSDDIDEEEDVRRLAHAHGTGATARLLLRLGLFVQGSP